MIVELKVDIDRRRPVPVTRIVKLMRLVGWSLDAVSYRRSPGGKGWHVTVRAVPPARLPRVTWPGAIVALQLLLGSDPKREGYNLARELVVMAGGVPAFWRKRVNVLFHRKVICE